MLWKDMTEIQKIKKRISARNYKLRHKDKVQLKNKEYYIKKRNIIKIKSSKYRKTEKWKNWKKAWYLLHPWYKHLEGARRRCNNKNSRDYNRYGLRGIKCLLTNKEIKELWFRDNAQLLKQPSIDRIDSNGNYEYNNCRFIEHIENTIKASCKQIICKDAQGNLVGNFKSGIEASRITGIPVYSIYSSANRKKLGFLKKVGGYYWEQVGK